MGVGISGEPVDSGESTPGYYICVLVPSEPSMGAGEGVAFTFEGFGVPTDSRPGESGGSNSRGVLRMGANRGCEGRSRLSGVGVVRPLITGWLS